MGYACSHSVVVDTMPPDSKIMILNNQQPVRLPGVVAQEARPGWITLEIPPTEAWEEPLSGLSSEQQWPAASVSFLSEAP